MFDMTCATADQRSAEQWARAVFEGPGPATRAVLVLGWRMVLRLRLWARGRPATFVAYRTLVGRIAWALAMPVHVTTVPRLLTRADRDKSGG